METTIADSVAPPTPGRDAEMVTLLSALCALRDGDASVRLPAEWTGVPGKVADVFNEIAELNQRMTQELNLHRTFRADVFPRSLRQRD